MRNMLQVYKGPTQLKDDVKFFNKYFNSRTTRTRFDCYTTAHYSDKNKKHCDFFVLSGPILVNKVS